MNTCERCIPALINERSPCRSFCRRHRRSARFIYPKKERRPFCNRFIHQLQRPERETLLRPSRTRRTERKKEEQEGNEAKNKQMEDNKICLDKGSIIPLLKNGQIMFDELQRKRTSSFSTFDFTFCFVLHSCFSPFFYFFSF